MAVGIDILSEVRRLYEDGLYLRAYAKAQEIGPLRTWTEVPARVMGGRLANVLGAPRLGRSLHLRAKRQAPSDPEACYFSLWGLWGRWGPWRAREDWLKVGELEEASDELRADWLGLFATISAMLRDFDVADRYLARALELAPDVPWIHIERCHVLQMEDRFAEALAAAEEALDLRPWFRPGVQAAAEMLGKLNRSREALDLLRAAAEHLECGDVVLQLADLQIELGDYAEAGENLARLPRLYPLMEKRHAQAVAARRCDVACHCDDLAAGIEFAREAGPGFFEHVARHLEAAGPNDRRVTLPVEFVQQHHVTCAPATLASLTKFWGREIDHLEIADSICYDGTPRHKQRSWAESHGFVAREFTIDWPTTVALIDRGLPFTLTTVEPPTSHLQAVIGYDARRRTLLLRDPSSHRRTEMLATLGLERYRSTGPQGMLLLPREEAARLDGLTLPEAELYDELHELQMALEAHDRARALAAHERMRAQAAFHRLTLYGRRLLAGYDADPTNLRTIYEQLLAQYPDDVGLLLAKLGCLRNDGSREERLKFLEEICRRPAVHPLFWLELAEELSEDARCHAEARRLLRRPLVRLPVEARSYHALADIEWAERRFDKATELYRAAACLNDKEERFLHSWFVATRHVHRVDEALEFLRARCARFGGVSCRPAITLYNALNDLDRTDDALGVLGDGLRRRPDDGELLAFAADAHGRRGNVAVAKSYLAQAKGRSRPGAWHRAAATLAGYVGDLPAARRQWEQLLQIEPQAVDAQSALVRLLAELEGDAAAVAHLQAMVERFPHNRALLRMASDWLRDDHLAEAEAIVRRLLEASPVDPWGRRELAALLARQQRLDEALAEADVALALAPTATFGYSIRARIRELRGELALAQADFRAGVECSVDNTDAIQGLVRCGGTHAERAAALEWVHDQLVRQTTFGDGLLCYRQQAHGVLPPETVLKNLRAALGARPDLWHAWSAVVRQLADMEHFVEALNVAQQETERFSLVPGSWLDLAAVQRARSDGAAEVAALEKAREINPNWSPPIRTLSEALERRGDLRGSLALLEGAAARLPLDAVIWGMLADVRWQLNDRQAALDTLERALLLEPGYSWAWTSLQEWTRVLGCPERAVRAARDLTVRRPGEARSWLQLARLLAAPEAQAERLAALDKALALNPRTVDAHLQRSESLCAAKKYDEAWTACFPALWGEKPPLDLRLQAARVFAAQGDALRADSALRLILKENPDYFAGWKQLAEWCHRATDRRDEYREAAEQLVKLGPNDAAAWRHLAEAKLAADDRAGAKAAFTRAIELFPPWEYARQRLFDLHLQDGELYSAEQALRRLLEVDPDVYVLARHVQLLAKQKERAKAVAVLEQLVAKALPTDWPATAAVAAVREQGWSKDIYPVLRGAIDRPEAKPVLFEQWAQCFVQDKQWSRGMAALTALADHQAGWTRASSQFLEGLAKARLPKELGRFVRKNSARLRGEPETWGSVGYALYTAGRSRAAAKWLADWRTRKGVRPWMLSNLAMSFYGLRRDRRAEQVHRFALTLEPDHATANHQTWLAAWNVVDGSFDAARKLVEQSAGANFTPYYKCLRAMVEEALRIDADPALRRGWSRGMTAERRLDKAVATHRAVWAANPALRRMHFRALRRLARSRGCWLTALRAQIRI